MLKIFGFIAAMILSPWANGTHGGAIENTSLKDWDKELLRMRPLLGRVIWLGSWHRKSRDQI